MPDSAVQFFAVHCDFADGSRSAYEGLTLTDLLSLVGTFDNLISLVECSIEPRAASESSRGDA